MNIPRQKKKDWSLTPEALEALLTRLDPDREEAAQKYERLHKALIAYFEHHGSLSAAELADRTFDGAARSLIEGNVIHLENPAGYIYGVGRNILLQYHRENANKFVPLDEALASANRPQWFHDGFETEGDLDYERSLECLDKCLDKLPEHNRLLVLQYYDGQGGFINNRKDLAERLGVSINALRVRAQRSREGLEVCVEDCLEADSTTKWN